MTEIIKVAGLNYHYEQEESNFSLANIDFEIEQGEWIAIIGHNGSGKSTLTRLIDGLLAAESGDITVDGELLTEESVWRVRRKIGMVFQNPDNQFVGATVADDVAFGMENIGVSYEEMVTRVDASLDEVAMQAFAEKEPARLSGGQKQRVAIAGMLALEPEIIILDEATSMLDPKGRKEVIQTIRQVRAEKNLTVLSITHDLDEAALADRIFVMDHGQLKKIGTPAEIFSYGSELVEMGLDVPFSEKLKDALKKRGVEVPENYIDEKGLVDYLWTSSLKK